MTQFEFDTERSMIFKWKGKLLMHNVYFIPIPNAMKRASSV